jgi:hypothetical protein
LICQSLWAGGCAKPKKEMPPNRRVFFKCGASMSYKILDKGIYLILFKNCESEIKGEKNGNQRS